MPNAGLPNRFRQEPCRKRGLTSIKPRFPNSKGSGLGGAIAKRVSYGPQQTQRLHTGL